MKAFFIATFLIGMFCCLCQTGGLLAQKAQQKTTTKEVKTGTLLNTYCDEVLPVRKKQLQAKADENCQTVSDCVLCQDRKLNMQVCVVMVMQPGKTNKCNPAIVEAAATLEADATSRGAAEKAAPAPAPFQFEVLQSTCTKSGTSLEVYVPGVDLSCDRSQYTFLWEMDGKKAGHSYKIECACGKEATVRVTQASTGAVMRKTVKLTTCDSKD